MFNVLASVSSAGTNILTGCLGHQYRGDFIYTFLFPYPLSINWRIILSQAATVSCLDALMSLSYITLLQVCLKHVNCTHWHQTQEITEIALVCLVSGKCICSSSSPRYCHSSMAYLWACLTAQSTPAARAPAASHHHPPWPRHFSSSCALHEDQWSPLSLSNTP